MFPTCQRHRVRRRLNQPWPDRYCHSSATKSRHSHQYRRQYHQPPGQPRLHTDCVTSASASRIVWLPERYQCRYIIVHGVLQLDQRAIRVCTDHHIKGGTNAFGRPRHLKIDHILIAKPDNRFQLFTSANTACGDLVVDFVHDFPVVIFPKTDYLPVWYVANHSTVFCMPASGCLGFQPNSFFIREILCPYSLRHRFRYTQSISPV